MFELGKCVSKPDGPPVMFRGLVLNVFRVVMRFQNSQTYEYTGCSQWTWKGYHSRL